MRAAYQLSEHARRDLLAAQAAALLAGQPAPASLPPAPKAGQPRLLGDERAAVLAEVWGIRKSVKAPAILKTDLKPVTSRTPLHFPYHSQGGRLGKLRRSLGEMWVRVLTSVSTAGVAGGKVQGSQGRNLARIVEAVRGHCFLRVDAEGRPLEVRESAVLVVEGEPGAPSLARECGMSRATFYRALRHPLAHLFLRTQKVQTEDGAGNRTNVATRFTVAMYDPAIPADIEAAYYAEPVELGGAYVAVVYTSQDAPTGGPGNTPYTKEACGKHTTGGSRSLSGPAADVVQGWEDSAALASKAGTADHAKGEDAGNCNLAYISRPDLWELAAHIAVNLGEQHAKAATVTYYKALMWLGMDTVRAAFQKVQRQMRQGRPIQNPGALLVAALNRKARAATGYNLRDLALNGGGLSA